jgi:threonine dehydrogenase-like Zn-dependent dehydrogenase
MKALVYTDTQQSEIRDVEPPIARENQSVITLDFCGICGSDMHAWHGHDERRIPPLVLGHEAVGVATSGPFAGQRVAINPLMTCGACDVCRSGNEHLCAKRELIGMRVPGAFAEQVAINNSNLSVLPEDLTSVSAALAEPLACAVNAVNQAARQNTNKSASIVVLGGGAIGLLAALVFSHHGYANIRIAETNKVRRALLERIGDFKAYDPVKTKPDDGTIDIVLDAVGSGMTRAASSTMVRPGGTIVHIGLQDAKSGLDTRRITLQEIKFLGVYCYRASEFADALSLLQRGAINGDGWTDIRPLDDGAAAFTDIHNGLAPPKIILQTS